MEETQIKRYLEDKNGANVGKALLGEIVRFLSKTNSEILRPWQKEIQEMAKLFKPTRTKRRKPNPVSSRSSPTLSPEESSNSSVIGTSASSQLTTAASTTPETSATLNDVRNPTSPADSGPIEIPRTPESSHDPQDALMSMVEQSASPLPHPFSQRCKEEGVEAGRIKHLVALFLSIPDDDICSTTERVWEEPILEAVIGADKKERLLQFNYNLGRKRTQQDTQQHLTWFMLSCAFMAYNAELWEVWDEEKFGKKITLERKCLHFRHAVDYFGLGALLDHRTDWTRWCELRNPEKEIFARLIKEEKAAAVKMWDTLEPEARKGATDGFVRHGWTVEDAGRIVGIGYRGRDKTCQTPPSAYYQGGSVRSNSWPDGFVPGKGWEQAID